MKGALLVAQRGSGPVYLGKWRDSTGRQVKRVIGPAWVVRDRADWRPRRGRVPEGVFDARAAYVALSQLIAAREQELHEAASRIEGTFAEAAHMWLHHLEYVKGLKPSTLADYRYLLASPDVPARKRGTPPEARIMRAFGDRRLEDITPADVERYLARMDDDPSAGPRTVNKHRQVISCVFAHAMRADTFGLPAPIRRARPTSAANPTPSRSTSTRPRRSRPSFVPP